MTADRFQFEQELMRLDQTGDDLQLIIEDVLDYTPPDTDEIANALIGLQVLFRLRFQKVFDMFEELVRNGDFRAPANPANTKGSR